MSCDLDIFSGPSLMAYKSRSRVAKQIQQIARGFGSPSKLVSGGVAGLLDTGVEEVQRVDQNIRYFPVEGASPYLVPLQDLIAGVNIVGVRTAGAFTVKLPLRTKEEQVIRVADERGTADSDVITVEIA
jgi:hypothetical protein